MGELLGWALWIIAYPGGLVLWGWLGWRAYHGKKTISKEEARKQLRLAEIDHQNKLADAKLWELLHEDDPAYLVAMGIEKPERVIEEEQKQKAKADAKKAKARQEREDRLRGLKPLTPMAYGGGTFDRGVEEQLEERMRHEISPETLANMGREEKVFAARMIQNKLQGQMDAARYHQQLLLESRDRRLQKLIDGRLSEQMRAQRRQQQGMASSMGAIGGLASALSPIFGTKGH